LSAVRIAVLLSLAAPALARGQGQHEHMTAPAPSLAGPDGISMRRMSSGTAWLPDSGPLHGHHVMLGDWTVMVHYSAFFQYIREFGIRGGYQFGSVNWVMLAATRALGGAEGRGGAVRLRVMASAEPWTVGATGYPELLQVVEPYRGDLLTDRQHPHDLVSEAAAQYERNVASNLALSLYAGPVGEPALGPVAFMHRPSAEYDPIAPLGHHLQDFTHTSFGVVTVGAFTRSLKLEASAFNGAHPDEDRTGFDPVRLNSYGGRITVNPHPEWSVATWFGHLAAQPGAHAHDAFDRVGLSVIHARRDWSSALVWAANVEDARLRNSVLLESTVRLARRLRASRARYRRAHARLRAQSRGVSLIGGDGRGPGDGAGPAGGAETVLREQEPGGGDDLGERRTEIALNRRCERATTHAPADDLPRRRTRAAAPALAERASCSDWALLGRAPMCRRLPSTSRWGSSAR
jgi:hypothetical protein